jgi:hypothetical protein
MMKLGSFLVFGIILGSIVVIVALVTRDSMAGRAAERDAQALKNFPEVFATVTVCDAPSCQLKFGIATAVSARDYTVRFLTSDTVAEKATHVSLRLDGRLNISRGDRHDILVQAKVIHQDKATGLALIEANLGEVAQRLPVLEIVPTRLSAGDWVSYVAKASYTGEPDDVRSFRGRVSEVEPPQVDGLALQADTVLVSAAATNGMVILDAKGRTVIGIARAAVWVDNMYMLAVHPLSPAQVSAILRWPDKPVIPL